MLAGIATDASGNVYAADTNANSPIQKFASNGGFLTKWNFHPRGEVGSADDVATDGAGNVYAAGYPDRIRKFRFVEPTRPKRAVKRIPVRGRTGRLTIKCPLATRCKGTVIVKKGKKSLVRKGGYSVSPRGQTRLKLRLTPAGRKALRRSKRVRGVGILTAKTNNKKTRFTAILIRR